MLKYGGLFVAVVCFSVFFGWLPTSLLNPIRASELKLLYKASTEGPGGLDDAVQVFVLKRPKRYAAPLVSMLRESEPGTVDEEVGLFFIESVRGEPAVDTFLIEFAQKHPDQEVRSLVRHIVEDPVPSREGF